jgi:hypothetical protein
MWIRVGIALAVVATGVVLLVLAPADARETYDSEDVRRAFAGVGLPLVVPEWARSEERVLAPRNGASFLVTVQESDRDAAEAHEDLTRMRAGNAWDARRANVLVISDEGVTPKVRRQIEAALDAL